MKTVLGFNDFKDQERVVMIARHHWWILFREVFVLVILFLVPFFLIPLVFMFAVQGGTAPSNVPGGVVLFFSAAWALVMWNLIFARWTDFYYDIWVITNWRIIDIDQKGFFNRQISTLLTLDHIQDIETTTSGIIGSVLNFGHVQVQTAAARDEFEFNDVANPTSVDETIRAAQEEELRLFGSSLSPHPATGVVIGNGL